MEPINNHIVSSYFHTRARLSAVQSFRRKVTGMHSLSFPIRL
uniref:Uncharacterized protein n=1 Tax=Anguilla anguilla TaxID=7936 RepID=A0A0E9UG42_ANGAN